MYLKRVDKFMKFREILVLGKLLKKVLKFECAIVVMLALVSATGSEVYAAGSAKVSSLTPQYDSGAIDVTTTVEEDKSPVYSINVIWGGMNFQYSSGEWEPEKGGYNEEEKWYVHRNTGNDIKVENHSNRPVGVSMSMEVDEDKYGQASENHITSGFRDITDYSGEETVEECNYEDGGTEYEETTSNGTVNAWGVDNAGQTSVYSKELCFRGKLPEDFENGSSIGVVTVTLTPQS